MAATDERDLDAVLANLYRVGPTEEERRKASTQSLARMGLGILAANQPSNLPRNPLGALAIGGVGGMDAYQSNLQQQMLSRRTDATGALAGMKVATDLRTQKRRDAAVAGLGNLSPETLKNPQELYQLALKHNAAGDKELGATFLSIANHASSLTNRRDPSQMERGLDTVARLWRKHSMGQDLSDDEQSELANSIAITGQIRTALDPVTQKLETFKPLELPERYKPMLEKYGIKTGARADIFPPPSEGGRKQLDQASEKELQGFNDAGKQLYDLTSSFKPNYGGWKLDTVGQAALAAGRRLSPDTLKKMGFGGLENQAQWWQNYYNWANDIRAAKFGLTLTGNELTAFERSTPKPSDDPAAIESALQSQLKILYDKHANRTSGLEAGGYNPAQVRETAGPSRSVQPDDAAAIAAVQSASARGAPATALVGRPRVHRIKTDAEWDMLPDGAVYIGPDGKQRTKKKKQ